MLPGFDLALGFALLYISLIVLLPLSAAFLKTFTMTWAAFWDAVSSPRVVASYRLTFGASFAAALLNAFFGLIVAWVLVRYEFPFKRLIDALVDLPFALPTAVAGIALTAIYAENGWIGQWLPFKVSFTPLGVFVALVFIGVPFVVRTVQPVLEDVNRELEEAAATLGASRWQTFTKVILPIVLPALLTGFALAFARALGEYGSVIFIAGNMPMISEITPLLIITKLEQYDYAGATAIAVVMLVTSFAAAAGDQQPADLGAQAAGGCMNTLVLPTSEPAPRDAAAVARRSATVEAPWVRRVLIGAALLFLTLFLFVPLVTVFYEAFKKGWDVYLAAILEPDARSAIALTLLAAAISVPANLVFGVSAAWAIAKFDFRGKNVLLTLIDLPFCGQPGHRRPDLRAGVRAAGLVRQLVHRQRPEDHLRRARHRAGDDLRHLPLRRARADSADAGAGPGAGRGGARARRQRLADVLARHAAQREMGAAVRRDPVQRAGDGRVRRGQRGLGHIRGQTNTMPLHIEIVYNEYQFAAAFAVASLLALLALVTLGLKYFIEQRVKHQRRAVGDRAE